MGWKGHMDKIYILLAIYIGQIVLSSALNRKEECEAVLDEKDCQEFCMFKVKMKGGNSTDNESCCLGHQLLDKHQVHSIMESGTNKTRKRRSIMDFTAPVFSTFKWPIPIHYRIDAQFSETEERLIDEVLDMWTGTTCVRFEKITSHRTAAYMNFTRGTGCLSFVGKIEAQPQPIFLSPTCFLEKMTIAHEVLHTLGMWHPHQQSGRDRFVRIKKTSVVDLSQFLELQPPTIKSVDETGYDYGSIMHYNPKEFSKNGRETTIETVDPLFQRTIGQRVQLSFDDLRIINEHYCTESCSPSMLDHPCLHGGYQNVLDCKTCICPEGWQGGHCQSLQRPEKDICGGARTATTVPQIISSPRYGLGTNNPYRKGQFCAWTIKGSNGRGVRMRFRDSFGVLCTLKEVCHDWIEIRFRKGDVTLGPRFCCYRRPEETLVSDVDEIMVIFKAQDTRKEASRRLGFRLEYVLDTVMFCDSDPCQNGGTCVSDSATECLCPDTHKGQFCQLRRGACEVDEPCENGGTCTSRGGSATYTCDCAPGYSGPRCQTYVPCSSQPCRNGGTCITRGQTYRCQCRTHFIGAVCDIAVDTPCASSPCKNGGTCRQRGTGFVCACPPTYAGPTCTSRVNPCSSTPCKNSGLCTVRANLTHTCTCRNGYTGPSCQTSPPTCSVNPCRNGGTCVMYRGNYTCACTPGYSGRDCQLNSCSSSPCQNGGTCRVVRGGSFVCVCASGYEGLICQRPKPEVKPCDSSPCLNDGSCVNLSQGYLCVCPIGTSGSRCERGNQPCVPNPCRNGGRCYTGGTTNFLCVCAQGYGGTTCSQVVHACDSSPCLNGGTCIKRGSSYRCACPGGVSGTRCQTITSVNHCRSAPCRNGGTCVRTSTGFRCICPALYTGTTCFSIINYCLNTPCRNGGTCVRRSRGFRCICPSGYTGTTCSTVIGNPCESNPCRNGATCLRYRSTFRCNCAPGYTSTLCTTRITNSCLSRPCRNNGRCADLPTGFSCVCATGYTGPTCTTASNPCRSITCRNGGTCLVSSSTYRCLCSQGYTGRRCETQTLLRECGGCGKEGGCLEPACGQTVTYRDTCRRTVTYKEMTSSGLYRTRTRVVTYACYKERVLPHTATCCPGVKLITVDVRTGERKCAVEGWSEFSKCSGHGCGACGTSTRANFTVLTSPTSGLQVLQSTNQESNACNRIPCTSRTCRYQDLVMGRCRVPCCPGHRLSGNLCI